MPVPGHGSLAVLTRGPATDFGTIEQIAASSARFHRLDRGALGYAALDTDFAEQIDQPPRARRQRRVIGLELNRDSFQAGRAATLRRGRARSAGLSIKRLMSCIMSLKRFPGLRIRPKRIGQFRMQLGEMIA